MKKLLAFLLIALFMLGVVGMVGCDVDNGIDDFDEQMEDLG